MKHLAGYQSEVDKGNLTAVASFEKLTFRALVLHRSTVEDYGLYMNAPYILRCYDSTNNIHIPYPNI